MKYNFNIGSKEFTIEPYNTNKEKEILLCNSFDQYNIDYILEILEFKTNLELSDDEKKIILYKYREISIGDELNVSFTCAKCKQVNELEINIANNIIEAKRNDKDILSLNKNVTDANISEFVKIDTDDLDIGDYEDLKQKIKDNQIIINFDKTTNCMSCGKETIINVGDNKYIINCLSEDTLMTLYKTYNYLTFFSNYTKKDIDSMYPFERTIFVGLLNKTKEDLN